MTSQVLDAQTVLREKLKVALRDIKQLFDDNLVDEVEYKDLKANELSKYKEKLAALAPGEGSTTPTVSSPFPVPRNKASLHTPMATPTPTRGGLPPRLTYPPSVTKSEPTCSPMPKMNAGTPQRSTPHTDTPLRTPASARHHHRIYLDPIHAIRLSTPPIFRRRPVQKRRIVVPSSEIASLSQFRGPPVTPKQS